MEWQQIFDEYQIRPNYVEQISDKVYKLITNTQNYCLKFSALTKDQLGHWYAVYRYISESHVLGFVPLILTKENSPYYLIDDQVIMVSPWIESYRGDRPSDEWIASFHGLGKLHGSTLQNIEVNYSQDQLTEISQYFENDRKRKKEELLQYIRYFESKRFMAPFELQACMHYRDLEWTMQMMDKWQYIYMDLLKDNQSRKVVLCHGNMKPSHYTLLNDNAYFLNWEYARMDFPSRDLSAYLNSLFTYHDCDMKKINEGLSIYFQYIRFHDIDKCELIFELLDPDPYLSLLTEYVNSTESDEIRRSIQLEKKYRQLLFSNQLEQLLYPQLEVNKEEV
ncbi:spore coat protein YsxE [Gracilibacillus ureilyticus]|uniref:Spore coat protein YsxE n=1 Tax=Gracilibacillus ureilyticus TaxID=531814 RepID=A0A1H9RSU4_9BACI|nr:phosphotransferase [Gracilibacillus ureilyticus]SER74989.1 spore coat protein YsxE [Gracilibacillus ureilyticus]